MARSSVPGSFNAVLEIAGGGEMVVATLCSQKYGRASGKAALDCSPATSSEEYRKYKVMDSKSANA